MEKPLSVKREDFIKTLVDVINGSDLPSCVAYEILRDITREAEALARRQYEADKKAWEESQKEQKNE